MNGPTHLMAGVMASTLVIYHVHEDPRWMLVGGVVALLPDTDTRHSMLGRYIPLWLLFTHRRFTHSYLALLLVTFVTWKWSDSLAIALIISAAYASHIVLDWLTKRGVWLWWPYGGPRSLRRLGKKVIQ